jgi:hypothetical protein
VGVGGASGGDCAEDAVIRGVLDFNAGAVAAGDVLVANPLTEFHSDGVDDESREEKIR